MNIKIVSLFLVISLFIAGCEMAPSKTTTGAALGGVAGGIAGSQVGKGKGRTVATIAGVLIGAAIGGAIGNSMDETDRMQTQQAFEGTRDNQTVAWRNPNSGNQYEVTPTRTYETRNGPCREYSSTGVVDGQRQVINGTVCRQPDGSWKVVQ